MRALTEPTLRRLMLALALTCALGWLFKAHCGVTGWIGAIQYSTGCYSDAVPFWGGRGVAAGDIPYLEARLEYPVLTGLFIWLEGIATRLAFGAQANAMHFLFLVTLANALLAAWVLRLFWSAGMEPRRLWAWALAPPLILYVGHNWDLVAIALAVAAVLLARERRLVTAAAVAGLGVAAKLFPIVLLPMIGLGALFGGDGGFPARLRLALMTAAAAILAWAAVNLPVAAVAWSNWSEFYTFSSARGGTAASSWELLGWAGVWPTGVPERNLFGALIFAAGLALILATGWRRHRERLWLLFTPALAWFMLTNKVYSPQFDLWLYPLLLMTAPRLAPVALFVVAGVAAYFAEFWWFAGLEGAWPGSGATQGWIALAAGVRAAAMMWLIADAVRLPAPKWLDGWTKADNSEQSGFAPADARA